MYCHEELFIWMLNLVSFGVYFSRNLELGKWTPKLLCDMGIKIRHSRTWTILSKRKQAVLCEKCVWSIPHLLEYKFWNVECLTIIICRMTAFDYINTEENTALQWRHNDRGGLLIHQRLHCLLNRLFRRRSKKTSKLCVTGICELNALVAGGFPPQRAGNV